jgi:murein DD-endopeptidase MepM/ murein hydrolase activator NlpD
VAITDVQFRISQIQSFMTASAVSAATSASPVGAAAGTTETSAAQFAAVLGQTLAADATAGVATAGLPGGLTGGLPAASLAGSLAGPLAGPVAGQPAAPGWTLPAQGTVTSEFGPRWGRQHQGVDIAAGTGTPVGAAAEGVVRDASWRGGYGKAVVIDHANGVSTLYGHNSELLVKPGDRVQAGQAIAKVGSTGDSTGPHLHFEVMLEGKKVDPRPWLEQRGVTF